MRRVLLLVALLSSVAAGALARKKVTAMSQTQAPPRLEFEGLRLLMTLAEVRAFAYERKWQLFVPEAPSERLQLATLRPTGSKVDRFDLRFERLVLTSFKVRYAAPDPERTMLRREYPFKRYGRDGFWAMTDAGHQTLVVITEDGSVLEAMHSDSPDVDEVRRAFDYYMPGFRRP